MQNERGTRKKWKAKLWAVGKVGKMEESRREEVVG
jgi:hypothetical protein